MKKKIEIHGSFPSPHFLSFTLFGHIFSLLSYLKKPRTPSSSYHDWRWHVGSRLMGCIPLNLVKSFSILDETLVKS